MRGTAARISTFQAVGVGLVAASTRPIRTASHGCFALLASATYACRNSCKNKRAERIRTPWNSRGKHMSAATHEVIAFSFARQE